MIRHFSLWEVSRIDDISVSFIIWCSVSSYALNDSYKMDVHFRGFFPCNTKMFLICSWKLKRIELNSNIHILLSFFLCLSNSAVNRNLLGATLHFFPFFVVVCIPKCSGNWNYRGPVQFKWNSLLCMYE